MMIAVSSIRKTLGQQDPLVMVAGAVAFAIAVIIATWSGWFGGKNMSRAPPLAPGGIFQTIREMTSDNMPQFLRDTAKLCNSYTFRLSLPIPGVPMFVVTGDAKLAREVLMDPFTVKPKTYQEFEPLGVGSIFTRNGHFWHVRRKSAAPAFSSNHIKRMNQVAMECTDKWIQEKLIPWSKAGKTFDVGEEMISITLDAICKTAFAYEITEQEKRSFTHSCELVFREFFSRSTANPLRKFFGRLLPDRRKALAAAHSNQDLAMKIVNNYRANPKPTKGTVIDLLASQSCYKNDGELGADVLTYLIAGHDTTAYSMAFALLELARNQDQQRKLQQDLDSKSSEEEWRSSNVLQMTIKEAMRLHPVSTIGSNRQIGRDFVTKEGWVLPKMSIVTCSIGLVHHNSTVFEKPEHFIPERWENPTKEQKDSCLVFSAGKQNCIGQSLANAELHCILPKILSAVDLEVAEEGRTEWFLTLKPVGAMLKAKLRTQKGN